MVNAPLEQQGGDHAAQSEAADQGVMRTAPDWHMADHALPTRGAPEGTRQRQMKACFICKDEFAAINCRHPLPKGLALLFISFGSGQRLFFRGSPKRCKARQTVERWTCT